MNIFQKAHEYGLHLIQSWLPGGHVDGQELTAKNPTRSDNNAGSFKINIVTGAWIDNATGDKGGDSVSLFAYLNGIDKQFEAAKQILESCGQSIDDFGHEADEKKDDPWLGFLEVSKGLENPPIFEAKWHQKQWGAIQEVWDFERKSGDVWRVVMKVARFPKASKKGTKEDKPFTLWKNGDTTKWRAKALTGLYPLWNTREVEDRPNDIIVLTEGQKVASRLKSAIGKEYICVGWYGGALHLDLSDIEPLRGREILFPFDAEQIGRQALRLLKELQVKVTPIYPPAGVPKGWDLADALEDGWSKDQIIEYLRNVGQSNLPTKPVVFKTAGPTFLGHKPNQEISDKVSESIYYTDIDNQGNKKILLRDDWFFRVLAIDAELANCQKFDYTIGVSSTAYENNRILEAAIDERLREYVGALDVTDVIIRRILREVEKNNRTHNRVADFIDILKQKHQNTDESVLDEFLKCLTFDARISEINKEEYEKEQQRMLPLYRELFHKFFLRMHLHIYGTKKNDRMAYNGLIENDIVPILEGAQKIGKTSLCRWLACDDSLYTDLGSGGRSNFGSDETVRRVRGTMIAELGEMKIMKRNEDIEQVKSFISAKFYDFTPKFIEKAAPLPATVSFIGTSNPPEYLIDDTGNRRFFPIHLKSIDKEYLTNNQELAEKIHAHYARLAEKIKPLDRFRAIEMSDELTQFMEEKRSNAMIRFPDHSAVVEIVSEYWISHGNDRICLQDHQISKMVTDKGYQFKIMSTSINSAMKEMGFLRTTRRDFSGKTKKGWWKIIGEPLQKSLDEPPF